MQLKSDQTWRYRAFISYSHAADSQLAGALQSALQQFAKPWYQLRAMRLFRDASSLTANPELWTSIARALDASANFILLASPTAAGSVWINKEVTHWLSTRSARQLLIVLTDGELFWDTSAGDFDWARTTALPRCLERAFAEEPLYIDLRGSRTAPDASIRGDAFKDAVADLSAALTGRSKDEIVGEDVRQHRRTKRVAWSAALALLALTILSAAAARVAVVQRDRAVGEQRVTLSRRLVAEAELVRTRRADLLPVSILLALESLRLSPSREARESLRSAMTRLPPPGRAFVHDEPVRDVSASSDGKHLATTTSGFIRIWSADSARVLRQIAMNGEFGTAFSDDGRLIAAAGIDTVRVLDRATGQITNAFAVESPPRALVFSPDGRSLAMAQHDGSIVSRDIRTGREVGGMKHDIIAMGIAFSADGKALFTGSNDNTARLWDAASGRALLRLPHKFGAVSVAISPDGTRLATGSWDGNVRLWDRATGLEVARIAHLPVPTTLAFSRDGRFLASGSADNTARVWDATSAQEVLRVTHRSEVTRVAFTPDGRSLLTASKDSTAHLWDISAGREVARVASDSFPFAVDFSPDNRSVATAVEGGVIVWDAATGRRTGYLDHSKRVYAAVYSSDGRYIATAANDGIRLWEVPSLRVARMMPLEFGASDVAFSADGRRVAAASHDGTLRVWNTQSGEEETRIQHPDSAVSVARVSFSPDGRSIATASYDGVRIWELATGKTTQRIGAARNIRDVAFSPDGKLLATAEPDHTVRIWDWPRVREQRRLVGSDEMAGVAFSPDGKYLATSSGDRTARVWEIETGEEVARMSHGGGVARVAFSKDGNLIASAASDLTTRTWRWRPEDLTAYACARLARNLTAQEWAEYVGDEPYHRTCSRLPGAK